MDAAVVIAILLAAFGVGWAMSRASRLRKEFPELAEKKPPRVSKRQKRLEQIRAAEPEFTPPSIEDLIAEEIADAGIDRIEGGDGIQPGVLLKAFRRDEHMAEQCRAEGLRFVVAEGIEPEDAGIDDVRLECDDPLPESPPAEDS